MDLKVNELLDVLNKRFLSVIHSDSESLSYLLYYVSTVKMISPHHNSSDYIIRWISYIENDFWIKRFRSIDSESFIQTKSPFNGLHCLKSEKIKIMLSVHVTH